MTKKTKNKGMYDKTLVIPIEMAMWESLRKISYEKQISMSQLARWEIDRMIKKYNKREKDVDQEC